VRQKIDRGAGAEKGLSGASPLAYARREAHFDGVEERGELAAVRARSWTRIDDYFESLARRRTARRSRGLPARTEPETPRFALSTLPFLALFAGLAVLAVGITISAWPGNVPPPRPQAARHEPGVAPKGWFQEAQKEMRRPG
jgi:hypothetical protein